MIEDFKMFLRDLHYCCYFMGSSLLQGVTGAVTQQKTVKKNVKFWIILFIISNCEVQKLKFNKSPRKRNDCRFVVPRIAQNLRTEEEYSKCAVTDFTAKMCISSATSYWQLIFRRNFCTTNGRDSNSGPRLFFSWGSNTVSDSFCKTCLCSCYLINSPILKPVRNFNLILSSNFHVI